MNKSHCQGSRIRGMQATFFKESQSHPFEHLTSSFHHFVLLSPKQLLQAKFQQWSTIGNIGQWKEA